MTDLSRLRVSLTKHGAHKISRLLKRFDADQVLANTSDKVEGINIDRAQTLAIMSAGADEQMPGFWTTAKSLGGDVIDATTMLAIAFSHHALIEALETGAKGFASGTIKKGKVIAGKSFTNFKNDIVELGYSTRASSELVSYDFSRIVSAPRVGKIARELFAQKLGAAGWDQNSDLADECVEQGFHDALSITENEFRAWLNQSNALIVAAGQVADDLEDGDEAISEFSFGSGHAPRKETGRSGQSSGLRGPVDLVHNRLQTKIHRYLVGLYGKNNVGTEQLAGVGLAKIDLVHTADGQFTFYELKTSKSVKRCIRDALPQLLEYCYWPDAERASALVILGVSEPNAAARSFLAGLRSRFNLPVFYQQVDADTGKLGQRF